MNNELITIKQLPIIEEHLHGIKSMIEDKVQSVLALGCTDSTVSAIRTLRADLKKDFTELENRRKLVKAKILEPYAAFEAVYKACVTEVFLPADAELKRRIDEVDTAIKEEKRQKLEAYFNEYASSKCIDFLTLDRSGIKINKSTSDKSLREQAQAFIDKVSDDLELIRTQEHSTEILVEYKKTLNVSVAIMAVTERYKAISVENERKAREEAKREAVEIKKETPEPPLQAPTVASNAKKIKVKFPFTAMSANTVADLKKYKVAMLELAKEYGIELIRE